MKWRLIRNIFLYLFIVLPFTKENSVRDIEDLLKLEDYAKVCCNENDKKLNWILINRYANLLAKHYVREINRFVHRYIQHHHSFVSCLKLDWMIYFKENPNKLLETLKRYPNPKAYLVKISSYEMIFEMRIEKATDVSFNCKCSIKLNRTLSKENYC